MPNCGRETPAELRRNGRPTLLWVSSSAHRWTDELAGIAAGIGAALSEHGNDLHLVGRFPPELAKALPPPILHQRWVPFAQFMALLAEGPFVAVAPLAHGLDAEEQAFLDCKSDIKAAQYGSSRIAAAYSAAIPYRDSDLPAALVPENTAAAWRSATSTLIEEFPAAGNRVGDDPAFQARRPSVVATSLLGMLERVRQPSRPPFSFRAIPTPRVGRYLEQSLRSARARLFPRR